jgi:hypothetical protein
MESLWLIDQRSMLKVASVVQCTHTLRNIGIRQHRDRVSWNEDQRAAPVCTNASAPNHQNDGDMYVFSQIISFAKIRPRGQANDSCCIFCAAYTRDIVSGPDQEKATELQVMFIVNVTNTIK